MKLLFNLLIAYCILPLSLAFGMEPLLFTVNELINGKQLYHNLVIQFQGEAVGQRLSKTSHVWVNLLDKEGNAIGAYMSKEFSDLIQHYGTYQTRGDEILIEGVYHSKCDEHGGDTDIHVQKLEILHVGSPRKTDPTNFHLVIGSVFLFCFILFLFSIKKKKLRQTS